MEELDATSSSGASSEDGIISTLLKKAKCWLFSHSRHLNFLTVLALASVSFLLLFSLHGLAPRHYGVLPDFPMTLTLITVHQCLLILWISFCFLTILFVYLFIYLFIYFSIVRS